MEGDGTGIEETHWFKSGAFDSVSSAKLAWRKAIDTGPSLFWKLFKEGPCAFGWTFQDFDLFQGRSSDFQGDLPYFGSFLRKVSALLLGPSRILALFKEGRQICSCQA